MTQLDLHHPVPASARHYSGRLVAPRSFMVDAPPRYFMADPGRYQLFAGWSSPWSRRSTLVISLAGLTDVVRVFHVETEYGLKRLRKAYGGPAQLGGAVSVPALWDAETNRMVSDDYATIDVDLAAELREWSTTRLDCIRWTCAVRSTSSIAGSARR